MVGIRKVLAVLTVLVMVACAVPVTCDQDCSYAAGDNAGILLFQVNPWGDGEGFSLKNYSQKSIDIEGYTVSDGDREGSFTFTKPYELGPGKTVTVVLKKTDDRFCKQQNVLTAGESGLVKEKNFALSNSGDNLLLTDSSGNLLDSFYYGSYSSEKTGWIGDTAKIKKGYYTERAGSYDSDSADDWFVTIPGQTDLPLEPEKFTATVTPFLFPDSGGIPIYRTLENATDSVLIQIYMLTNTNVYGLLAELLDKGVEVSILHEGAPVGTTVAKDIAPLLHALVVKGADVRFIGGTDNDRYENMHAKYAVVDGKTVIVTSENWTRANLNGSIDDNVYKGDDGNRGWGAVVESPGYAAYMTDVFRNDSSPEFGDTYSFMERYPESNVATVTYQAPADADFQTYQNVPVTPVLSNDTSYDALEYFINGAEKRVYSQQQSLSGRYADPMDESSPVYKMAKKASAGLDVKFILSGGVSGDDHKKVDNIVAEINSSTQVSAARMDSPYVHNKGLICDDTAWVSSINWTPTSVENNRECCVVLHSKAIADMFAESFLQDFDRNYTYDGFRVDASGIERSYESGKEAVFEVTVTPEGDYTYEWDFGDGETRTTTIPKVAYTPTDGAHVLTVKVTGTDNVTKTVKVDYYVGSEVPKPEGEEDIEEYETGILTFIIPILVILLAVAVAVTRKGKKSKKKKSKGKKRK